MSRRPRHPIPLRDQLGQSQVEYVGALLFVATVVALLIGFAPDLAASLLGGIRDTIDKILGS